MQEQNNPSDIYFTEDYSHLLIKLKKTIHGYKGRIIESGYDPELQSSDYFVYDPLYKEKAQAAKECLNAANELVMHIKGRYKQLLSIKNKRELPKWIYKQQSIMKTLNKTRFADVYGYITKETMSLNRAIKLTDEYKIEMYQTEAQTGKQKGKAIEHYYVFFIPDYTDMENELKLGKKSIQKYLKKFCEIGILKRLRKSDARGITIYAAGYYSQYIKDGQKQTNRILFLKESPEMKEALRRFKIRD